MVQLNFIIPFSPPNGQNISAHHPSMPLLITRAAISS
jgi:hypothetical protein